MGIFRVNIYIETSIHGPAVRTAAGMYTIEYIRKGGAAETRQGIIVRDRVTENALVLETLSGAFGRLTKPCSAGVFTECTHILNVMNNHYLPVWEKNGWTNARGRTVANKELWQQVSWAMNEHLVSFYTGSHSYRQRMQFDLEKAIEAYHKGREYRPDVQGRKMDSVHLENGGYRVSW